MEKTKGGKGSTNHAPKKKPINEDIKVSVCLLFLAESLERGRSDKLQTSPLKLKRGEGGGVEIKKKKGVDWLEKGLFIYCDVYVTRHPNSKKHKRELGILTWMCNIIR